MAIDIESFKKTISTYKDRITPLNLFSLFKGNELVNILRKGYFLEKQAPIAVYFNTIRAVKSIDDLENSLNNEREEREIRKLNNPVCLYYRDCHPEICNEFDRKITFKYYTNEWKLPHLYRCHLQIWDMAYPLKVKDELVVGVLFVGQNVIESEGKINLFSEFGNAWWKYVKLNPFGGEKIRLNSNQKDDITEAIDHDENLQPVEKENIKNEFSKLLNKEMKGFKSVETQELIDHFEKFIRFGELINKLLNELYKLHEELAEKEFVNSFNTHLTTIDMKDRESWMQECSELLRYITEIIKCKEIILFLKNDSKFEGFTSFNSSFIQKKVLKARDVFSIAPNRLIKLDWSNLLHKDLLHRLEIGDHNIQAYRSHHYSKAGLISSLIIEVDDGTAINESLLVSLCNVITKHADLVSNLFLLNEQQQSFKDQVNEVAHSFRTPLHLLLDDIDYLLNSIEDEKIKDRFTESRGRIFDAKNDLKALLDKAKEKPERCDVIVLIKEVIKNMTTKAKKHPCLISMINWPVQEFAVEIIKRQIKNAFINLLDNAIKYSYHTGGKGEYDVKIFIHHSKSENKVQIIFQNYGIGIPPDDVEKLNRGEPYKRSEVPDTKKYVGGMKLKKRSGDGLGFSIAMQFFNKYNWDLNIQSDPADDNIRKQDEKYHRYVTKVFVTIPLENQI